MILTGIGKKNFKAFSMLLGTDRLRDNELYIGAIEEEMAVGAGRFSGAEDVLVVDSIFVLSR